MYRFYYDTGRASLAPHLLLAELNARYELTRVDVDRDENRRPDYLRINPTGEVPTLVDEALVLPEAVAICLHLIDRHPDGALGPSVGQPERPHLYRWLAYLSTSVQPTLMAYHYPRARVQDDTSAASVRATAEQRLVTLFGLVDHQLRQRPFLLGSAPSACDYYLLMLARWSRESSAPARGLPHLGRALAALSVRPAVRRAFDEEGISPPYF